jgi:hypothetical protein
MRAILMERQIEEQKERNVKEYKALEKNAPMKL